MDFNIDNITSDHLNLVLVGYLIVFSSLTALALIFNNLPKLLSLNVKKLVQRAPQASEKDAIESKPEGVTTITGEETAAISAAIFLFVDQLHDQENTVLTIQRISKKYSPWSSKIYNVTNGLNKRF